MRTGCRSNDFRTHSKSPSGVHDVEHRGHGVLLRIDSALRTDRRRPGIVKPGSSTGHHPSPRPNGSLSLSTRKAGWGTRGRCGCCRSDFITTPDDVHPQSGAVILIPSEYSRRQRRPSNGPRSSFTNWCTSAARTSAGRCSFGPSRHSIRFIRSCGFYYSTDDVNARAGMRRRVCPSIGNASLGRLLSSPAGYEKSSLPAVGLAYGPNFQASGASTGRPLSSQAGRTAPPEPRSDHRGCNPDRWRSYWARGADTGRGCCAARRASTPRQSTAQPQSKSSDAATKGALGDANATRYVEKHSRVLDPNGKPVAKAVVEIIAADGQASADTPTPAMAHQVVETDSAGRFVARVPASHEFGLMVRSNQGAITRLVVPEGADALADIQLARGVALSGRVLCARRETACRLCRLLEK